MIEHDPFQPICGSYHPIEIVSEGYGVCHDTWGTLFWPWAFTPPSTEKGWVARQITGRDGMPIKAWVMARPEHSKESALAVIQRDIDLHRALPFDEERERERLMPV